MDRFFKMFSKSASKKDSENKAKEEEDVVFENNTIAFEVEQMKPSESLNHLVKDLKIGGVHVDNFEAYNLNIDKLLGQYNEEITEIDYRFSKICEGNEIMPDINTTKIEKMKTVGKVGEGITILDENSLFGKLNLTYNKSKIQGEKGFTSIRTNNAVYKRKWYYEVQLVTNGLQQIGWCQVPTPFTAGEGVGDDATSFAYDGYRVVMWHSGKINYGGMWDVGDVIGCCIDLDAEKIEYFQNGKSLGTSDVNVPVGENIAYFPAISIHQEEKVIFNFGKSPFQYCYPGYEPIDIPDSMFNGCVEITIQLVDLLKHSLLKLLFSDVVQPYDKISLTNKIFNFLTGVAFKDIFVFKTILSPFLFEIGMKNELGVFFRHLFLYLGNQADKLELINTLFDNICGMIEENGLKGEKGIEEYKNLIVLFVEILKIDFIVELWIENGKTTQDLKRVFNTNVFKMGDLYDYLKEKYANYTSDITVFKAFKEIKNEYYEKFMLCKEQVEFAYTEHLKHVLLFFMNDKRTFSNKMKTSPSNERTTLKSVLVEFVNKGNDFSGLNNVLFEVLAPSKKDNNTFLKNFVFNLYAILSDYMCQELSTFGVDLWFTRLNQKNLFYDEIGIGGTINHVTSEYSSFVEESFKAENNTFASEMNNRIIKISTVILLQLRDFTRLLDKYKKVQLKQLVDFEHGSEFFSNFFRCYFYLYNEQNQISLYKYAFFLIKWINQLIRSNKYLIYFMPKSVFDIPFDIFRFLHKIKANVICNSELRKKVNASSPHFANDDFNQEIVLFYTCLFSDQVIANPEIKESLIVKIEYFMKKRAITKTFEINSEVIQFLIRGLLNYMSNASLCHIACEIMVKIIKPICFGNKSSQYEKGTLVNVTKVFFENDINTFHEFMNNYTKLMNKVMTEYTLVLNECASKVLGSGNVDAIETKSSLLKKFAFAYNMLCDLMKIFEFLLAAYPDEFFDISTLNYSRFVHFLKNTSSRILEKGYLNQLVKLLERTKASANFPGGLESLLLMGYSLVGIFLNIEANKENPKFAEFIKKLANLPDLDMEPFLELYKIIKEISTDPKLTEGIERYRSVIEFFNANADKKRDRTMSTEEWEETNKNENICIICYTNTSDRVLIPCKHICCNECLMQYLSDKKHCFICNAPIENTEVFKPEPK